MAKFVRNLRHIDALLRELLKEDVEFEWGKEQQSAFWRLKELCSQAPALKYFDVTKPVEIHCNAISKGLGAVLVQDGQPVAYSSRSLTSAETRYAQIEKELLLIIHACVKFHQFIYGRKDVVVYNDYKPLEAIFKKPLAQTPLRLQRMRLSIQWYDINIVYRKGTKMTVPDTLSKACLLTDMTDERTDSFSDVSMLHYVTVSDDRYADLQRRTKTELADLTQVIKDGLPDNHSDVAPEVQSYWNVRSKLTVLDDIVYRGMRITVPPSLRPDMIKGDA